MHEKLTEVGWRSTGLTKSWMKVLQMHRKLTKGPADARTVDGWFLRCTESWQRLMKGPADIRRVDGRSHGCTESLWKFLRPHGKLTDVDGRSRWCTESWWIVPRMHRSLTKVVRMSIWSLDLPSTSCVSAESSVNFRQISVSERLSVNFLYVSRIFLQLPWTCRAAVGPSVNFLCVRGNIRQISMRQQDFHQHSSTLCPSARHSVNSPFVHATFHQLSVCPWKTFCSEAGPSA